MYLNTDILKEMQVFIFKFDVGLFAWLCLFTINQKGYKIRHMLSSVFELHDAFCVQVFSHVLFV